MNQNHQLYYLNQRDPHIRSQLVPVPVEQDLFMEQVIHYFRKQIERKKSLNPNQHLEIEIKLGTFFAKEQNFKNMLDNFKFVSRFRHLFVHDFMQFYTFQPNFLLTPWSDLPYDNSQYPMSFSNLQNYLCKLSKIKDSKLDKVYNGIYKMYVDPQGENLLTQFQQGMRLDIQFQNGQRGSLYFDGRRELLKKDRGDSLDIMKDQVQFRITTQIENKLDISNLDDLIQSAQVRSVRFKAYMTFNFQFLEVGVSRVLNLSQMSEYYSIIKKCQVNGNIDWQEVMVHFLKQLYSAEPVEHVASVQDQVNRSMRRQEIEFEVVDTEYVAANLDPAIRRMIRNVDSFFYTDKVQYDILYEKIRKIKPESSRSAFQPPLIGNYLQQSYNLAYKYL